MTVPVPFETGPSADPPHRGMSVLLIDEDTVGLLISEDLPELGHEGPNGIQVRFDDCRVPAQGLLVGRRQWRQTSSSVQARDRSSRHCRPLDGYFAGGVRPGPRVCQVAEAFGTRIAGLQAIRMINDRGGDGLMVLPGTSSPVRLWVDR